MADERLIPPGIRDQRSLAFNELIHRLGSLDLTPLLLYLVDQAEATALPHLAEQFSVMGYDGWLLTTNDDERRELIKKAIELHRHKGTPWAVKEAIKAVGYADVEIKEHFPKRYHDGSFNHDRSDFYGIPGAQWALFRVIVDLGLDKGLTQAASDLIRGGVHAYKNQRSWVQHIGFRTRLTDQVELRDDFTLKANHQAQEVVLDPAAGDPLGATIRYRSFHNGLRQYNGATYHGATFVEAI